MAKKFYKIPDGTTKINEDTFIGHEKMHFVYIPNSVESIEVLSFEEMWDLRVLVVPYGFIQPRGLRAAFHFGFEAELYELKPDEFIDEEGVIYRGQQKLVGTVYSYDYDFHGEGFTDYSIPYGVEEICEDGFYGCQELESVHIPNTVKSIRGKDVRDAFVDCGKLRELHIPESVVSLGPGILPENLETLIIPEHLLGTALEQLYSYDTIPNHLKKLHIIKGSALPCEFAIPYPDWIKIKELEVDANCVNYSSIDGVLFNKQKTKLIWCPAGREIREFTVPNTVEILGDLAFNGCEFLKQVTIPSSVQVISATAFEGCDAQIVKID